MTEENTSKSTVEPRKRKTSVKPDNGTATLCIVCGLPNGVTMHTSDGKAITLQNGLNPGIPADVWADLQKTYGHTRMMVNGHVYGARDARYAADQAADAQAAPSGFDPVDPANPDPDGEYQVTAAD